MRSILDFIARFGRPKAAQNRIRRLSAPSRSELDLARRAELRDLGSRLGYSFADLSLLEWALTHRSFAHETRASGQNHNCPDDYECLEFLGDSVVGFVVSEYLFLNYPSHPEGELSKIKSFLVSTAHLSNISQRLGLGAYLRLSHGEEKTGGRAKHAILADLFESLTAAIYLDGGLKAARGFLLTQLDSSLKKVAQQQLDVQDYKSRLQEQLHVLGYPEPRYRVIHEAGPAHKREFLVEVSVRGTCLAQGGGKSKKAAQQKAAQLAIEALPLVQPLLPHHEPEG